MDYSSKTLLELLRLAEEDKSNLNAIYIYKIALEKDIDRAYLSIILPLLAARQHNLGYKEEAIKTLDTFIETITNDSSIYIQRGNYLISLGRKALALKDWTKAYELDNSSLSDETLSFIKENPEPILENN